MGFQAPTTGGGLNDQRKINEVDADVAWYLALAAERRGPAVENGHGANNPEHDGCPRRATTPALGPKTMELSAGTLAVEGRIRWGSRVWKFLGALGAHRVTHLGKNASWVAQVLAVGTPSCWRSWPLKVLAVGALGC